MKFAVGVCLVLVGCGYRVQVPENLKGDIHVIIENYLDADLCEFSMTPPGSPPSSSWLKHSIGSGGGRQFDVKADQYKIAVGCGMTYHGMAVVDLRRSTTLEVSVAGSRPTQGGAVVVPVFGRVHRYVAPVQQQQPSGGAEEPAPEGAAPEEPSSGGNSEAAPAGPTVPNPGGLPSGATCDQSYKCASNACVTHSPNNYCR